jgi:putative transposase
LRAGDGLAVIVGSEAGARVAGPGPGLGRGVRQQRADQRDAVPGRRHWRAGGEAALASKGAGGALCRLSPAQLARLRAELDKGPAAWG